MTLLSYSFMEWSGVELSLKYQVSKYKVIAIGLTLPCLKLSSVRAGKMYNPLESILFFFFQEKARKISGDVKDNRKEIFTLKIPSVCFFFSLDPDHYLDCYFLAPKLIVIFRIFWILIRITYFFNPVYKNIENLHINLVLSKKKINYY